MHLLGVLGRRILQCNNFLWKNLGHILVVVRFADDQNGLIRLKQRLVLVVIFVHT